MYCMHDTSVAYTPITSCSSVSPLSRLIYGASYKLRCGSGRVIVSRGIFWRYCAMFNGVVFPSAPRQVYSLMARRLRELCSTLRISDELRLKIWTCFEYSLVHCTDLMVDRHLDQLLMCAIYIIAKVGFWNTWERSFVDVVHRWYRMQGCQVSRG